MPPARGSLPALIGVMPLAERAPGVTITGKEEKEEGTGYRKVLGGLAQKLVNGGDEGFRHAIYD